jgi:hypothetical protein
VVGAAHVEREAIHQLLVVPPAPVGHLPRG